MFPDEWKFAFQSMDLLQKWIYKSSWIDNMHNLKARVICYNVDDTQVQFGDSQCVFDPTAYIEYSMLIKDAIAYEEQKQLNAA